MLAIFKKKINNKTVLVVAVLVVAAVIVVVVPQLFQKSKPASQSSGTQAELGGESSVKKQPPAEVIKNCTGTIQEIQGQVIKLKAEKEKNPFGEDRYFEIAVNKETKILTRDNSLFDVQTTDQGKIVFIPKPGADFGTQKESQQWRTLSIADLEPGNSIAANGSVNLRKENSFTAVYIIVID